MATALRLAEEANNPTEVTENGSPQTICQPLAESECDAPEDVKQDVAVAQAHSVDSGTSPTNSPHVDTVITKPQSRSHLKKHRTSVVLQQPTLPALSSVSNTLLQKTETVVSQIATSSNEQISTSSFVTSVSTSVENVVSLPAQSVSPSIIQITPPVWLSPMPAAFIRPPCPVSSSPSTAIASGSFTPLVFRGMSFDVSQSSNQSNYMMLSVPSTGNSNKLNYLMPYVSLPGATIMPRSATTTISDERFSTPATVNDKKIVSTASETSPIMNHDQPHVLNNERPAQPLLSIDQASASLSNTSKPSLLTSDKTTTVVSQPPLEKAIGVINNPVIDNGKAAGQSDYMYVKFPVSSMRQPFQLLTLNGAMQTNQQPLPSAVTASYQPAHFRPATIEVASKMQFPSSEAHMKLRPLPDAHVKNPMPIIEAHSKVQPPIVSAHLKLQPPIVEAHSKGQQQIVKAHSKGVLNFSSLPPLPEEQPLNLSKKSAMLEQPLALSLPKTSQVKTSSLPPVVCTSTFAYTMSSSARTTSTSVRQSLLSKLSQPVMKPSVPSSFNTLPTTNNLPNVAPLNGKHNGHHNGQSNNGQRVVTDRPELHMANSMQPSNNIPAVPLQPSTGCTAGVKPTALIPPSTSNLGVKTAQSNAYLQPVQSLAAFNQLMSLQSTIMGANGLQNSAGNLSLGLSLMAGGTFTQSVSAASVRPSLINAPLSNNAAKSSSRPVDALPILSLNGSAVFDSKSAYSLANFPQTMLTGIQPPLSSQLVTNIQIPANMYPALNIQPTKTTSASAASTLGNQVIIGMTPPPAHGNSGKSSLSHNGVYNEFKAATLPLPPTITNSFTSTAVNTVTPIQPGLVSAMSSLQTAFISAMPPLQPTLLGTIPQLQPAVVSTVSSLQPAPANALPSGQLIVVSSHVTIIRSSFSC